MFGEGADPSPGPELYRLLPAAKLPVISQCTGSIPSFRREVFQTRFRQKGSSLMAAPSDSGEVGLAGWYGCCSLSACVAVQLNL